MTSHLAPIDWVIILAFIGFSVATGVVLSRRGRSSVREYFTSGASTPWWLLGTSMVATTFAADTPLALSGWVVTSGVAQNWYWWCQVPVTTLGVFFIARLWRRANLVTDNEIVSLRYSGWPAAMLRGFRGLFFSLVYGTMILGWVNLAMTKIIQLTWPNIPRVPVVDEAMLWTYLHTPLSDELEPSAREMLRLGRLDPLDAYYGQWQLQNVAERPAAVRELGLVFDRLAALQNEVGSIQKRRAAPEPAANGKPRPTEADEQAARAKLGEYGAGLTSGPLLARFGLEAREAELSETWTKSTVGLPAPAGADAPAASAPAALRLVHAVDQTVTGVNKFKIIVLLFVITVAYTVISGLWGVLITDFFQFWIAMGGCIVLAVLAVQRLGGMDSMLRQMAEIYSESRARGMVSLVPVSDAGDLTLMPWSHFAVFVLFSWYVLQFTDGGSYLAQRMLAAKDERHAALGYLWYSVAHYCLRMWPWIIVGFAAAVMFPYTRDAITGQYPGSAVAEEGYVRVMLAVLPVGMMGLMLAAFLAAYMSTISSQINLGASYLLNDFYRPFVKPGASERHYVILSQLSTVVIAAIGLLASLFYSAIGEAWFILSSVSAGIGAIYLLRWFWWRINAWSEMVCLATLLVCAMVVKRWPDLPPDWMQPFPMNLLYLAPVSVGVALLATMLTKPVDQKQLIAFVRQVQPGGWGWRRVEKEIRRTDPAFRCRSPVTWSSTWCWVLSTAAIYCYLFGIGKLVVGDALSAPGWLPNRWWGVILLVAGSVLGWLVVRTFSTKRWAE